MTKLNLKAAAFACLMAAGTLAAPSASFAGSLASTDMAQQAPNLLVEAGHRHRDEERRWHRERRHHHERDIHRGGFTIYLGSPGYRHYRPHKVRYCTTERAVWKARDWGLRHVHVVRAGESTIKVRGSRHGYPVTVKFSRAPGCPVLATY